MTYSRRGGLHFLRIGRLSISWSWRRKAMRRPTLAELRRITKGSIA